MEIKEWSDTFDVLLNSYNSGIVLDEYEKSVFLTAAQLQLVKDLYTGALKGDAFEETEELRTSLRNLIKSASLESTDESKGISVNSKLYKLPEDLLYITYEEGVLNNPDCGSNIISIIPISQDEYTRTLNNPFKQPNRRRAFRLDTKEGIIEVISKYDLSGYNIRYIAKPEPIILVDLENNKIDNKNKSQNCKLDSSLHHLILSKAITLVMQSKSIGINN